MTRFSYLLIIIFFSIVLFNNPPQVLAGSSVVFVPKDSNPSAMGYGTQTNDSQCALARPSSFCSNGSTVGTTTCTSEPACTGGSVWTKYSLLGCYPHTSQFDQYDWLYNYNSAVYSTADKCTPSDGASYLRSGYCDGSIGGIYKTCCNNSGGGMASQSCVQVQPYSGAPYPPYDGVCPSGSHSVTCGYAGAEKPTCGPSACSVAPTPVPTTPTPVPTGSCYSGDPCTAGQVGSSVCSGTGVAKTCYNFGGTYCWWPTTCSAGTACYAGACRVGCAEGTTQSICIEGTSCNL